MADLREFIKRHVKKEATSGKPSKDKKKVNKNYIIALRFQPIRSRRRRWLFLNNHLLKMNNHLSLQFIPHFCILDGLPLWHAFVLAVPRNPLDLVNFLSQYRKYILTCFSYNRIEINNLLEVFVQISKTSFRFCNNLGLRPRLLPNPISVFDFCTNTSNSLCISITTQHFILLCHTYELGFALRWYTKLID